MSDSSPEDILSWEDLIYIADFLELSGERKFPILGGEPTLHPDFNDILIYLIERNFDVNVFTSGIMSDRTLDEAAALFKNLPEHKLTFVCNLNDPRKTRTSLAETESIKRFMRYFGSRITPGFNIYRNDFELEFLFEYINEYGLHRNIRLGIAHPIPGKGNRFIQVKDFDKILERLFSYMPLFERLRVRPGFDCGFPLCRLDDEQLGWLYRYTGGHYDFGCGPVIDIGPDMTVWSCFPLSSLQKKSLFEFNSLEEIRAYFQDIHNKIRTEAGGIFEDCDICRFREEHLCAGGCLAHSLTEFQNEPRVRMKEVYL